jgi:hypothetical protein
VKSCWLGVKGARRVTEEAGGTESPASGSMPMAQEVRLQY